jgi:hypothetical protein
VSYRVERHEQSTLFRVAFSDEPPNLFALAMAPARRELELDDCEWLVLAFAIRSGPDRAQIAVASEIAREFNRINVGVRPFDEFNEFETWLPGQAATRGSMWARLSHGELLWTLTRGVGVEELRLLVGESSIS